MLNHLKSFHWLVTLAMGNIESDCIIGGGQEGWGATTPQRQPMPASQSALIHCPPLPLTRHTQLLCKPRGHLSPPRYLWLHCPCLSLCLMQSTALTTPNSSANQDPAEPLESPQILTTSLWTVSSNEAQLPGSFGLVYPGRGVSGCQRV